MIFDLVGVGAGPFNLSLAILLKDTELKNLFLDKLSKIEKDKNSNVCISEDYSLKYKGKGKIFYLNGGKHTHGVVDPNLSLTASRARRILLSLDNTFSKPVKQDTIFGEII